MNDWTDEEWGEYIREVNAAYWAEEDEFRAGVHPTQLNERQEYDRNT